MSLKGPPAGKPFHPISQKHSLVQTVLVAKPAPIGVPASTAADKAFLIRGCACQREIVVRRKIDARTRLEAAQPVIVFQGTQGRDVARGLVRDGLAHGPLSGVNRARTAARKVAPG